MTAFVLSPAATWLVFGALIVLIAGAAGTWLGFLARRDELRLPPDWAQERDRRHRRGAL